MKKVFLSAFLIASLVGFSQAIAETYFCSSDNYTGDFNPDAKGTTANCEHLKDLTLPYMSCQLNAQQEKLAYDSGLQAYQNGKCHPYQTLTMKYGTASCSARFIVTESAKSYSVDTQFGKSEERDMCVKQLEAQLFKEYPQLKEIQNIEE
ncbi:hypothetical protein IKQ26_03535 [bacterium]|nr:hypothetical protein [bacterium]